MGLDYNSYTGFGFKLADGDTYDDVIEAIERNHEDYYDIDFSDDNIELIVDGMCGNYIYLLYIIDNHDPLEDNNGIELSLTEFKETTERAITALSEAVNKLGLPNVEAKDIKFISFTHVW